MVMLLREVLGLRGQRIPLEDNIADSRPYSNRFILETSGTPHFSRCHNTGCYNNILTLLKKVSTDRCSIPHFCVT